MSVEITPFLLSCLARRGVLLFLNGEMIHFMSFLVHCYKSHFNVTNTHFPPSYQRLWPQRLERMSSQLPQVCDSNPHLQMLLRIDSVPTIILVASVYRDPTHKPEIDPDSEGEVQVRG